MLRYELVYQEDSTSGTQRLSTSSFNPKESADNKSCHHSTKVTFSQERQRLPDEQSTTSSKNMVSPVKTSLFSTSASVIDDSSCDSISKESAYFGKQSAVDIFGVRIVPAVVSFANTFENQSYMETVSVQNISKCSVIIRIHNPRAWSFRLLPIERGHLLAPGLKVTRRMHYTCTKLGIVHSSLPIYVNEKCYELPLEAFKGQAFVEIIPNSINFGRVDIGSKPVEKRLVIKNVSSCATKFSVDLGRNELDLQVSPLKGWIRPHSSVTIRLQLIALQVGEHSSEVWVTTDLSTARVQVTVQSCKRDLIALHPNSTSDFTLIEFPTTFYGCRRYQTVVVYNMAAASCAFVVLADFGNQNHEPLKEAKKNKNKHVKMFDVEPVEGRINPFEGRIFTIWFQPLPPEEPKMGWKSKEVEEMPDFLCAVRIKRIQVDDYGSEKIAKSEDEINSLMAYPNRVTKKSSIPCVDMLIVENALSKDLDEISLADDISVLLCLYGEAEPALLTVVPDVLHFTDSFMGTRTDKVVHLTNHSSHMLAFRYRKKPFFEVSPSFKNIEPKATCDVVVTLCAHNIGVLTNKLVFEVLAQTDSTDAKDFNVVNCTILKISGQVMALTTVPQPKFNPGITPMITNEVGFLTDEVTFSSKIKKPRCAMAGAKKQGRPWLQTDATIAFPNDMPLTLRPRAGNGTVKTIFKGLDRYIIPVDESMTYTVEKLLQKKALDKWFLDYIRGTAALAITKEKSGCCKPKYSKPEADPTMVIPEKSPSSPRDVLVPLTFVQLYRITVSPAFISFGSVTTSKNCTQLLTIENNNDFQISAKILPITSGIHIQTLENFIIKGKSETKIILTFHREMLGRYTGTITCVINGYHSFDVAVVAEVVPKSLILNPERVDYKVPELPFTCSFVPVAINNPLNTAVSFSWAVLEGSPFKVEPLVGVTPKKSMVWCAAYFEPDSPNYKLHPVKLSVEGVLCHKLKTGVTLSKPNTYFLEPILSIGYIPIKLTTIKRFVLFNPDFSDNMFVVLNKDPFKGIKVEPSSGSIKARSCFTLALIMNVTLEGPLDFVVYINIQNSVTIELKVTGAVVYPQVEITPKYVSLTRVPCNSVTRTTLVAENKSKARAEVCFDMEEYPQFKVSLSKSHHDPGISSKGFGLEPQSTQKFYLHFIPKDLASYDFYLPVVLNNYITRRNSSVKDVEAHAKKIKTVYRASSFVDSRKIASGVMPSQKATMSHLVLIDVVVLKPQLLLSETELFFTYTSETKTFTTKNITDESLNIVFRCEEMQTAFSLLNLMARESVKDRLSLQSVASAGEQVPFTAVLTASAPGSYTADVTIVVTLQEHTLAYNVVRLSATIGPICTMYSSVSDIYFTPVPLGVDISYMFHLTLDAQKHTKETVISYEMSNHFAELLSVEFVKGNTVPAGSKSNVQVKVTFRSNITVSIKIVIVFCGSECGECSVNVFATADNCLLTTHAFLKFHLPRRQALKENFDFIEKTESDVLLSIDRNILQPSQQMFGPMPLLALEQVTSSDSSNVSNVSLLTTVSTSAAMKRAAPHSSNIKAVPGQGLISITTSDVQLSMQLDIKEEKSTPATKESIDMVEVIAKENDESVFPMFPLEPAITEYAVHMNQTRYAVQQWVYEQVFSCSYYPVLGSHTFSSFTHTKKEYGRSAPVAMRNVFDVLEKICGRSVRRYFTPLDKLPEENTAKVLFTYNVYKQLLDFMAAQGALLSHVEPSYLMGYDDYCLYKKITPDTTRSFDTNSDSQSEDFNAELPNFDLFMSITVQCWLDLFLQIFRTLILSPLFGMKVEQVKLEKGLQKCLTNTSHDVELKRSLYTRAEEQLMSWLTNHFNTQRSLVWLPPQTPAARTVHNFDSDLEDGLVLTAVTAAFCPYLTELHFSDMCLQPVTISQAYHNTVCLTSAWQHIKLGFSVTPRDFVRPNTVKMLMLVAYLYKVLPSYKPESTIKFMAILNSSETQVVTLENAEESTITYHVEILPNTASFTLDNCKNSIALKRKQKCQISVQYTARNTAKVKAILLLCGACLPPKFGRNYVFLLEGNPVKLPVTSMFNILSPLNIALSTRIIVETPHNVDVEADKTVDYDIWITDAEPQPGTLNAICWAKERKRKIPRRLFILSDKLVVDCSKRQKVGQLLLQVCCFSLVTYNYWLLLMNPVIGDFIIKLQISPIPPESSLTISVVVDPSNVCSCKSQNTLLCSRSGTVSVPCRNLDQWSSVRFMFELTISSSEKEFWGTYIESNIGFRLLQWMLEEKKERLNQEIELVFKKSKTYKVSCTSPYVSCAPTLYIPNVRARTSIPIKVHFAQDTPNHSSILTLTSLDNQEIRSYTLNIVCRKL